MQGSWPRRPTRLSNIRNRHQALRRLQETPRENESLVVRVESVVVQMILKPISICGNAATLQIGGRVPSDRYGECEAPHKSERRIRIKGSLRGKLFLDTVIHECLHLAGWHISEEFVTEFAQGLAEILTDPDIEERILE